MGNNIWDKSRIKKGEVENNILKINDLMKKYTIMNFTGLNLFFSIDEGGSNAKKIIKVIVKKFNSQNGTIENDEKIIHLTLEQFFSYYNALVNSLSTFYEAKLEERLSTLGEKDFNSLVSGESGMCPICEEEQVNVSLPCSHFFCEECIKAWVIKSDTCPMCRFKLKHNKENEKKGRPAGIEGSNSWLIINNDDKIKQEIKKENIEIFIKLTNDYFLFK
jgi:hypothetical protein